MFTRAWAKSHSSSRSGRTLLDNILTDPVQWQELAIFKFKPEEVHRLERRDGSGKRRSCAARRTNGRATQGSEPINQVECAVVAEHTHESARGPLAWRNTAAASLRQGAGHDHVHDFAGRQSGAQTDRRRPVGRRNVVRASRRARRHFRHQQSGFQRAPFAAGETASPRRRTRTDCAQTSA